MVLNELHNDNKTYKAMPRKKLTENEKKMRGTYRPDRPGASAPDASALLTSIPEPPAKLDKIGAKRWYEVWGYLVERKRALRVGLPQIEQYCDYHVIATDCRDYIREHGAVMEYSNRMKGPSPYLKVLTQAESQMRQIEDRWGLTPKADAALPQAEPDEPEIDEFDI